MVKYYSQGGYPLVYLQDRTRFSLVMKEPTMPPSDQLISHRVDIWPYQANDVSPVGNVVKNHYKNFYLPWTAPNGAVQVYGYDRVVYEDIFAGIDMVFYSGSAGQKLAFYCWPGSDPTKLTLQFFGHDSLRVDVLGHLKVWLDNRWIELREAAAYQVGNQNEVIPLNWGASYAPVNDEDLISFYFDTYDPELPLVLQIGALPLGANTETEGLCWSTYFGGAGIDQILASTTDVNGNYYITGYTGSDFLDFHDAVGTDVLGQPNAVLVAKFGPAYELQWMVFYGGTDDQFGHAIKSRTYVNGIETTEIYIGGYTVANDLYAATLSGAYNVQTASGFQTKGFIARFQLDGTIDWSTYFGDGNERVEGMDFDTGGRLYIVGQCDTSYPQQILSGATNLGYGGGGSDLMVARFGFAGDLEWCTSIGGSGLDYGADIVCHNNGFYVSGRTESSNFPVAGGGAGYSGSSDVVLMDFSSVAALQWSSHHGGSGFDRPGLNSLAVDDANNLLVVGETYSGDLPTQDAGGFYMANNNGVAGFIARYASGSNTLLWSTYVSGQSENVLESITVGSGKIFVAGFTEDYGFPLQAFGNLYFQEAIISPFTSTPQGGIEGIVMGFEPNTQLAYSTYFGGDQGFFGDNIFTTAFHADRLFLGGTTSKNLDPTTFFPLDNAGGPPAYFDDSYDPALTNFTDGFLTAICTDQFTPVRELYQADHSFLLAPQSPQTWFAYGLDPGNHLIELWDAKGQLVHSDRQRVTADTPAPLRLPALAPGVYTCRALGPLGPRMARIGITH
jgi:hypothetical protein